MAGHTENIDITKALLDGKNPRGIPTAIFIVSRTLATTAVAPPLAHGTRGSPNLERGSAAKRPLWRASP